ncbi:hypothetical protein IGI37_003687 [Enterococcus sp. AZ194]|uniref:cupin domain-containing protein n=1 Tax=Enterococcus sp. AZ194 TaxID=2774629 RepID=UPI003F1F46CB
MLIKKEDMIFESINSTTERCVVTYGDELMSVIVRFPKKTETPDLHSHKEEQVTYILKGSFKFWIEEQVYIVTVGDILRFESHQTHGCIALEDHSELLDTFAPIRKDFL